MFDVGNTDLVEFKKIRESKNLDCHIFGKLECSNPAGSTKDRIAKQIIDTAIKCGKLLPGHEIVEATSGNTGIALAKYGTDLGYKVKIFMPENMSDERKDYIRNAGAELVLTDANLNVDGSIKAANKYVQENENCFYSDQFNNVCNYNAHYLTTGPEIWEQTGGQIDAFVAGIGTGGTLLGVGNYLKEKNPDIKLFAVIPADSPHVIQGIGDGFDPPFFKENKNIEEVIKVTNSQAMEYFHWINNEEGYSAGISSGANLSASLDILSKCNSIHNMVIMCADGVDRY